MKILRAGTVLVLCTLGVFARGGGDEAQNLDDQPQRLGDLFQFLVVHETSTQDKSLWVQFALQCGNGSGALSAQIGNRQADGQPGMRFVCADKNATAAYTPWYGPAALRDTDFSLESIRGNALLIDWGVTRAPKNSDDEKNRRHLSYAEAGRLLSETGHGFVSEETIALGLKVWIRHANAAAFARASTAGPKD